MKPLTIQEIHTYQQFAERGIVSPLQCIVNPDDHLWLMPDVYENDQVFLYCLTCKSKLIPGLDMINAIRKAIKIATCNTQ